MAVNLEVYVEHECFVCRHTPALAAAVKAEFPEIHVELINLAEGRGAYRDLVVAVPTFILNGRVFSLGNPAPGDLRSEVARLLEEAGT